MGSLGTIPESHARTAGQKQLAVWLKEGRIDPGRGSITRRLRAVLPRRARGPGAHGALSHPSETRNASARASVSR